MILLFYEIGLLYMYIYTLSNIIVTITEMGLLTTEIRSYVL